MKKITLLLSSALALSALAQAQQINGIVTDAQGKPAENASVSLHRAKDSSVLKIELTKSGAFSFTPSGPDSLFLSISYVGHEPAYSRPFRYEGNTISLPGFRLDPAQKQMEGVTVTAKKQMVEVRPNKTILNIEQSATAIGSDALELFRKSPGITVDKDDQISLYGKNGVQVMIDNKPTPLSAQQLSAYLKSIPAAQIEAIEIIQNPPSSLEAAGTGGVINIRMKKNKKAGFSGSVFTGLSASKHGRTESGLSLYYKKDRVNLYGNYSNANGYTESDFRITRLLKDSLYDQQTKVLAKKNTHAFNTGLDYNFNSRHSIGFMMNGNFSGPRSETYSLTPISHWPSGNTATLLAAGNFNRQRNTTINSNLSYAFRDSAGRSLTLQADHGYYSIDQDQWQPNLFFDSAGKQPLYARNYIINSPSDINIYAFKADYNTKLGKGQLGFGGKVGYVVTNNTFDQFDEQNGRLTQDWKHSNRFGYKENVNAAYLNYNRQYKTLAIQAGLRMEQTVVKGILTSYEQHGQGINEKETSFKRDYIDLFPNLSLTYKAIANNQFTLSYAKRIDRPAYQNLNPFEYRITEYTYHKGSTELRPQYSQSISLTHTYKQRINTTLSYTRIKDVFGQLVDTASGNKGLLVHRNLANQDMVNLNISVPFQYKNYSLFVNANSYYTRYEANFGEGRQIDLDAWAVNLFAQNSLRLKKGWTVELSGFYSSPSIWQGSLKTKSIWSVDAGIQKPVLKGRGTLKASVTDLFHSLKWEANSNFSGQQVWAKGQQESRQFKLNFTYRIGKGNVKQGPSRKTGTEEENQRAQGSGGLVH
ncbi:TonB dependent receptor [Flavihumibacter rivuli]|uniref:outer membrane beta-barrel family protein n=1 Tax=Flavihumibacter rivuli TaxID=2838156 RepID=UPI001BDEF14D|nr:outer membrane beta-barrel family protein [Flavihumibacter rivuli]ULQ55877.1 TonB dependent receptor [Flavihumibacter rivuli]